MLFQLMAIGNLTKDPEEKTTANGKKYALFTVAVNDSNRDTNYVRVKAWGNLGESCLKYLVKGRKVFVIGELEKPYAYVNNEGNPVASITIGSASKVEFVGGIDANFLKEKNAANSEDQKEENTQEESPKQKNLEFTPAEVDDLPF